WFSHTHTHTHTHTTQHTHTTHIHNTQHHTHTQHITPARQPHHHSHSTTNHSLTLLIPTDCQARARFAHWGLVRTRFGVSSMLSFGAMAVRAQWDFARLNFGRALRQNDTKHKHQSAGTHERRIAPASLKQVFSLSHAFSPVCAQ